jgi:hypothetical protein
MSQGAFSNNDTTVSRCEYAWKRIETLEILRLLSPASQEIDQRLKTFGGFLSTEDDLAPLLQAMRGTDAIGKPALNIFKDTRIRLGFCSISSATKSCNVLIHLNYGCPLSSANWFSLSLALSMRIA